MKIISAVFVSFCVILTAWLAVSYLDIISDNITPEPQHSNINAFVLFYNAISEEETK